MIVSADYSSCLPQCSVNNCTYCQSGYSTYCAVCNPGYYLDTNYQCQTCFSNCRSCNVVKCLACQPGFQLSNDGMNCTQIICPQGFSFDGYNCYCPSGTY